MVQIIPEYRRKTTGERFSEAFGNVGEAFPKAFSDYVGEREKKEKLSKLQEGVKRLTGKDVSDIEDETMLRDIHKAYEAKELETVKGEGRKNIEEVKQEGRVALEQEKSVHKAALQEQKDSHAAMMIGMTPSEFQKSLGREGGKVYQELSTELANHATSLDSLDRAEELVNSLRGPVGVVKSLIGSKEAAELDALGTTVIAPVVKLLNPSGVLPMEKLKMIMHRHSPSSFERAATSLGKIKALRRLSTAGIESGLEYAKMLKQYDGNIPPEELGNWSQETMAVMEATDAEESADQSASLMGEENPEAQQAQQPVENPPPPPGPNGKTTKRNPQTGEVIVWDPNANQWVYQ